MKIVPISKFEYKVFPIEQGERTIEITEEEYRGLELQTMCLNEDLTAVIAYVKTQEELEREEKIAANMQLQLQISSLKRQLSATDYKTLKYMEGELTEEEYYETKSLRRSLREEINRLESQIVEV